MDDSGRRKPAALDQTDERPFTLPSSNRDNWLLIEEVAATSTLLP